MNLIDGAIYRINDFASVLVKDNKDGTFTLKTVVLYGLGRYMLENPSRPLVYNTVISPLVKFRLLIANPVNMDKPRIKLISTKRIK